MATLLGRTSIHKEAHAHPPPDDTEGEVVDAVQAWQAALEGYFVPDDNEDWDEPTEEKQEGEELVLLGDADKLTSKQKEVMMRLKEASQYSRLKLKQVNLSFSGASVYFFTPMRADGVPLPSSVLKFDTEECVRDELEKTNRYGRLFGLTTPKVKDSQFLEGADPNEPASVMQIDLCGGIFGLPEFASAPPVKTFASVIEEELQGKERKVDLLPLINEALERRIFHFTMSSRKVKLLKLASTYKLVRFVGHGILNRAKEGAKRAEKSPALAAGFQRPADVDDLDPEGCFLEELSGKRQTSKEYFQTFVGYEQLLEERFERRVVAGFCHNDLHGGNLLLDSQGLVWLIDFATVKDNVHVLMDLTKFLAACLFMYLQDNVDEQHIHTLGKVLVTAPDATTAMPSSLDAAMRGNAIASTVLGLVARLRHCMCIYESGDDVPDNEGLPSALAFFSWATRMLSYSEPNLHQKGRALYCAIAGAQRLLWEAGVDVGPVACSWIEQNRMLWEEQKSRHLSVSVANGPQIKSYDFDLELPRYLSQVGASEAWSTDFLTREQVNVTEHSTTINLRFQGRLKTRYVSLPWQAVRLLQELNKVYKTYVPELLKLDTFFGRVLVVGDAGSGKSMLTKQLFSEVAQKQVCDLYKECTDQATEEDPVTGKGKTGLVPVRVPLIDLSRQLEASPDTSLQADPKSDLLTDWVKRRHGEGTVPHKLLCDVRDASVQVMKNMLAHPPSEAVGTQRSERKSRRSSVGTARSERKGRGSSVGMHRSGSLAKQQRVSRLSSSSHQAEGSELEDGSSDEAFGLLLLLDGLDEACDRRPALLSYLTSLMESEPMHLPLLTTRPGSIGLQELATFGGLGFVSFCMGSLTTELAQDIVTRTLHRLGESKETLDLLMDAIADPAYSSLVSNPLVLTLLIHVLRKNFADAKKSSAAGIVRTASAEKREVLRKTDVYQRAMKLMLHQSDAAKFMLRDAASDLATIKRLERLKSSKARKFFQSISWQAHTEQTRGMSWDKMSKSSEEKDILQVFRETFEQGRLPLFEPAGSSGEEKVQMTHLSFQELLTGEYTSAVVRHSHLRRQTKAYINFCSSNSSKILGRDRLSEQWWLQIWFHVGEMLNATEFDDWCDCLAEDRRCRVGIGSVGWRNHMSSLLRVLEGNAWMDRPWIGGGGVAQEIEWIDWDEHRAKISPILDTCKRKWLLKDLRDAHELPCELLEVQWPADGVATILRHAARTSDLTTLRMLLRKGVYYGVCDDFGTNSFTLTYANSNFDAMQVFVDHKADICFNPTHARPQICMAHMYTSHFRCYEVLYFLPGHEQLRLAKQPAGVLKQASEGSLDIVPELDVNFTDAASGMTLLMYAAAGGHAKLVANLLQNAAAVNAESSEGCTALTFACDCARGQEGVEVVRLLLDAKADVTVKAGKTYYNRFFHEWRGKGNPVAVGPTLAGELEKIELLAEAGFDFNSTNDYGVNCLWMALLSPSKSQDREMRGKVMQRIFDLKADLHARTKKSNGSTHEPTGLVDKKFSSKVNLLDLQVEQLIPLMHSNEQALRFTLANGCDPNAKLCGIPVFGLYMWFDLELSFAGDTTCLEILLDAKVDLNEKSVLGIFTLMWWTAYTCRSQQAMLLFVNRKGSLEKPKGSWFASDFYTDAKKAGNEDSISFYEDWVMMQQQEGEDEEEKVDRLPSMSSQLSVSRLPSASSQLSVSRLPSASSQLSVHKLSSISSQLSVSQLPSMSSQRSMGSMGSRLVRDQLISRVPMAR